MSVQSQDVVDDRPCASCGYNLRGQSATWDRPSGQWRATCPECGTPQAAVTAAASPREAMSLPTLAIVAAVLWTAWTLLTWLAFAQASILSAVKTAALRASTAPNARMNDILVDSLPEILAHVAVHGTRLALCGLAVGALTVCASRASAGRRAALACGAIALASLVGTWMYFVGWWEGAGNDPQMAMAMLSGRLSGQSPPRGEWTFVFALAVVGLLIALVAGRAGVAIGPGLARWVAGCFAPPDRWPAFLRDRTNP